MPTPNVRALPVRWEVEWWVLTPAALARRAADPYAEHNRDEDEQAVHRLFASKEAALRCARRVVDAKQTVYGHAIVIEQHLEPIEGTPHRDWENHGEPIYVE